MSAAVETMLPDAPSEGANGAVARPKRGCHGMSGCRPWCPSASRRRSSAAIWATDAPMPSGSKTRMRTSSGNGSRAHASSTNPSVS
jgi:hypothetical protein